MTDWKAVPVLILMQTSYQFRKDSVIESLFSVLKMRVSSGKLVFYFKVMLFAFTSGKPVDVATGAKLNATIQKTPTNSDITFPEEDVFLPSPPSCQSGDAFCEHFPHYPHGYVERALRRHRLDPGLFGVDAVPEYTGRDSSDTFMCKSRVATVFPKVGRNIKNDWRIIVNQGNSGEYVQGVVVETCVGQGSKCDVINDLVDDMVTSCKQKYIYRRLLSLNDKGQIVQDSFKLPSACCCTYRTNYHFFDMYRKRK
ncbi:unnamed protein product [Phyllotreta striolata]|uniref:Spaetzle domain-containing protein n=1 Tax=Phyllotreta striolata TaxID=444603 RepID=A0A9N9THY7_PHYSR|nr:unnamed protein product [Phyllotreta striolata]